MKNIHKNLKKQLETLSPGDLVCVYWNDASIGSSFSSAGIPVPVMSWGVFVGSVGEPKHIILAQSDFAYNPEIHDDDYIAIPYPWFKKIEVLKKAFLTGKEVTVILNCIIQGVGSRRRRRIFQMRTQNHERLH
jgi:hypothetical protein